MNYDALETGKSVGRTSRYRVEEELVCRRPTSVFSLLKLEFRLWGGTNKPGSEVSRAFRDCCGLN